MKKNKTASHLDCSPLDVPFDWNAGSSFFHKKQEISSDESDHDNKNEETRKRKITKAEKKEKERQEEQRLRKIEEELMNNTDPKTADQFDRLLLGQPNNSALWIKYMSFHLQATEFEKAKSVAKRALETINMREEQEKLNIWVALLNLENLYGTKETLKTCFQDAIQRNDDYQVHRKMLEIFVSSNRPKDVDELATKMCKKYKNLVECWLFCAESLFKVDQINRARLILEKGLTSLSKKEHILLITKFAILENRYGSSDEAQTLFEHIITSYPARIDVWNCYVDMLIKSNFILAARNVLERACLQNLPPRKMKSIYTKRLTFEQKFGDQTTIKNVKKEAQKYVSECK